MKGNIKGFTLVELLAVIVILAIIALITAPAILNVINDARVKGAQDKAWGTIDAVRLAYTQEQGMGTGTITATEGDYVVCFGTTNTGCTAGNNMQKKVGATDVRFSGDEPKSGTVTINLANGMITCTNLRFEGNGSYTCTSDGNKMCCLNKSSVSLTTDATACEKQA